MTVDVDVAQSVFDKANGLIGEQRSAIGRPSEYDFVSGPLAAAIFAFGDFDRLPVRESGQVRSYIIPDPVFGPVTFVAVRRDTGRVEIVGFDDDPDYWAMLGDDPY